MISIPKPAYLRYRGHTYRRAEVLLRKNGRLRGVFHGQADGTWHYDNDYTTREDDWYGALGLINGTLAVEGATEHHSGFRKALPEMVAQYPELLDLLVSFDGPSKSLKDLLGDQTAGIAETVFLHGTSTVAWEKIKHEGLRPRSESLSCPTFGARGQTAPEGDCTRIYLTTQEGVAHFAARDAAALHGGQPLVLQVGPGLNPSYCGADEDSGKVDAESSLAAMGNITYRRSIPPNLIKPLEVRDQENKWTPYREASVRLADRFVWTGWTCVSGPADFVRWLVDRGETIAFDEFAAHVDVESLPLDEDQAEMLPTDWSVTFLKTELPSGKPAYVMQYSGIEHLCLPSNQDYEDEQDLAGTMIDWMDDTFGVKATWQRTEQEIAAARKHFLG